MKATNLLKIVTMSLFFCSFAHADPISFVTNISSYGFRLLQVGSAIPLVGAGLSFKGDNHDKGYKYLKGAAYVALLGFGGAGIMSLMQSFAR